MEKIVLTALVFICFNHCLCRAQLLQFGTCADVETMKYFELEKFLGVWYEIERYPTWYENYGSCAYKRIESCGRRIEIEHVFVRNDIEYILHVNSTYIPGDEAVFVIQENNIDRIGIPLSVITTDYTNYAVVYGCKNNLEMDLKYIAAWILSRTPTLEPEILAKARQELTSITYASAAYFQHVEQRESECSYYWTAHVQAVNVNADVADNK